MDSFDFFLIALFSIWAALSIGFQFNNSAIRALSYRDCFGLLPLWTFFAPSPGQTDYHLIYRDQLPDGSLTDWTEITLAEPRKVYSWIWNPEKRTKKVLADVVQMLIDISNDPRATPQSVLASTPYVLILNTVDQQPRTQPATHRQFVIAQTRGFLRNTEPQVLLKSLLHRTQINPRLANALLAN